MYEVILTYDNTVAKYNTIELNDVQCRSRLRNLPIFEKILIYFSSKVGGVPIMGTSRLKTSVPHIQLNITTGRAFRMESIGLV